MLLSNEDIAQLKRKGYSRDFFMLVDSKGYATLKNQKGHCVFYDITLRRCKVRSNRPSGCRIYPVIHDEDNGIIVDSICPAGNTISEKQKAKRGKKVLKLLETIDAEAKKRHSN
jgi:Fe-S-cluster containining protein